MSPEAFDELFGSYLGQDWLDDYGTWERAVDAFAAENEVDVDAVIRTAEAILQRSSDEAVVEAALEAAGCAFNATFFGKTYHAWLAEVVGRLRGMQHGAALGSTRTAS